MITAEEERHKYILAWTIPAYRDRSPGERLLPHFLNRYKPGTIIDLGSGTGRAAMRLKQAGFNVTMLDITSRCMDPEVRVCGIPFLEACLWEPLPFSVTFDYFYCTDVMEHIPPEHVDKTLDNIKTIATGGFFQVALFDETFGRLINDTLHLTVRPWDWWADKISDRWNKTEFIEIEEQRLCAFVA